MFVVLLSRCTCLLVQVEKEKQRLQEVLRKRQEMVDNHQQAYQFSKRIRALLRVAS